MLFDSSINVGATSVSLPRAESFGYNSSHPVVAVLLAMPRPMGLSGTRVALPEDGRNGKYSTHIQVLFLNSCTPLDVIYDETWTGN